MRTRTMKPLFLIFCLCLSPLLMGQNQNKIQEAMANYDYETAVELINKEPPTIPLLMQKAKALKGIGSNAEALRSIRQVIARVKAVLRRTSEKSKDKEIEKLEYETLALDTKRIKATVDGVEVPLTKKEFEILKLLLENKGNVFSREEILSRIWKDEVYVLDRTIDVNITRLRKKIGPYGKNIVTRLGFGYCFEC